MTLDLNSMSRKDLQKLRRDVDKAIESLSDREKKTALDAAEKVAAEHGFSLADLTRIGSKASKAKSPAKYRNTADASQTWTGKGRQPDWFKSALASGKSASDFEI